MRYRIRVLVVLCFTFLTISPFVSSGGERQQIESGSGFLFGTLELPQGDGFCPVVLIISGSGPTDRDGNSPYTGQNNSLKFLAEGLRTRGIASLRFDKRGVGLSSAAARQEKDLRIETYISDAILWCDMLRTHPRFTHLVIIGHSEGSLIGMIACKKVRANGFVSLAGPSIPASELFLNQLRRQLPPGLYAKAEAIVNKLKRGEYESRIPPEFYDLFRYSVQPYLVSWFKYNPTEEIARLQVPILVAHGTTDLQVSPDNAEALSKANPSADLAVIKGMNHVLKNATFEMGDRPQSYSDPGIPVAPELIDKIAFFVRSISSNQP